MNEVKAVFFDMDDTLINFGGVIKNAWTMSSELMLKEYPVEQVSSKTVMERIILRKDEVWNNEQKSKQARKDLVKTRYEVVTRALQDLDIHNQARVECLVSNYSQMREEAIHIFPNTLTTLQELKNRGYALAMITNGQSETQRNKIERFGLAPFFDEIYIEGEVGFGKPEPKIYQQALKRFGIQPSEACMVGDNYMWEVVAPKKLGMYTVWENVEKNDLPKNPEILPDKIIHDISELLPIFTGI